jgi:hypothetical protein
LLGGLAQQCGCAGEFTLILDAIRNGREAAEGVRRIVVKKPVRARFFSPVNESSQSWISDLVAPGRIEIRSVRLRRAPGDEDAIVIEPRPWTLC